MTPRGASDVLRHCPEAAPELAAALGRAVAAAPHVQGPRVDWAGRARVALDTLATDHRDPGPLGQAAIGLAIRARAPDVAVMARERLTLDDLLVDEDTLDPLQICAAYAVEQAVVAAGLRRLPDGGARAIAFAAWGRPVTPSLVLQVEAIEAAWSLEDAGDADPYGRTAALARLADAVEGAVARDLTDVAMGQGRDHLPPSSARVLLRSCVDRAATRSVGAGERATWAGALGAGLLAMTLGRERGARVAACGWERVHLVATAPVEGVGVPAERIRRMTRAMLDGAVSDRALDAVAELLADLRLESPPVAHVADLDPATHPMAPLAALCAVAQ